MLCLLFLIKSLTLISHILFCFYSVLSDTVNVTCSLSILANSIFKHNYTRQCLHTQQSCLIKKTIC